MRINAQVSKRVVSNGEQMGHTCSVVVFLSQWRCTEGSYVRYGLGAAHALVYAINACLSSSFLPTVRGFGSRFGPIAKWPFPNETSFCKDPHFAHVPKTLKKFQSFLNFHFVKNGSKLLHEIGEIAY